VRYQGILPDLFREGQGVVAEGILEPTGTFKADTVLAPPLRNLHAPAMSPTP
jgi:cytochrome c-type biogenesis protein CcmE